MVCRCQEREGDMGISLLQLETTAGSLVSKISNSLVLGKEPLSNSINIISHG